MEEKSHLLENHKVIQHFLDFGFRKDDLVSNYAKATIAQFLINLKQDLQDKLQDGYVKHTDILESQIQQLSKCILDLKECQEYMNYRENLQ